MRKVLVSLKPYYYYLVGEGIKEIEVRKKMPRASDWNKEVLFYMSKDVKSFAKIPKEFQGKYRKHFGKVGMQFVCDWVYEWGCKNRLEILESFPTWRASYIVFVDDLEKTCLTYEDLDDYGKGKPLYGLHISDLKIYDKPKELSEFVRHCRKDKPCIFCEHLKEYGCENWTFERLTRPPQSWQYVEVDV